MTERHTTKPEPSTRSERLGDGLDVSPLLVRARAAEIDAIPGLLGEVEAIRAVLWRRLHAPSAQPVAAPAEEPAREVHLLKPGEAASRMGVSVRWLYRHHAELPFARKLSRKTLRFSEPGLRRWLAARRG